MTLTDSAVEAAMLDRLAALPAGKSLDPTELARAFAGADEKVWRLAMTPIRRVAVRLALSGRATILRKGKAVDAQDFKGVYRIGGAATSAHDDPPSPVGAA